MRTLSVFAWPSLCAASVTADNNEVFKSIRRAVKCAFARDQYNGDGESADEDVSEQKQGVAVLKEVLSTYRLLFGQSFH
ncbi:hypothetical protein ASPCAL03380 [Aspergillus calidoustus]|uniref:Uncharacterized protein n=1 Tax=Aspergillus calidoustus TaxID=454130 RepID=A0A0U5FRU8_ASPCI|nr:hypothetical protein ASPCAL03380 [Aspergillus calidoustus]